MAAKGGKWITRANGARRFRAASRFKRLRRMQEGREIRAAMNDPKAVGLRLLGGLMGR